MQKGLMKIVKIYGSIQWHTEKPIRALWDGNLVSEPDLGPRLSRSQTGPVGIYGTGNGTGNPVHLPALTFTLPVC